MPSRQNRAGRVGRVGTLVAASAFACSRPAPEPPTVNPGPGVETINGTERIGWDQRADAAELATIRYAIYVDGNRSELTGVTCANTATAAGFACSARLPAMSAGSHTLEIASFVVEGSTLESGRSLALRVTLTPGAMQTTSGERGRSPAADTGASAAAISAAAPWPAGAVRVAAGFDRPSDLAVLPDGRVFVAERSGQVRIVRDGAILTEPALILDAAARGAAVAIAGDPQFERSRYIYVVHTERRRSGGSTFTLARYRESGNTLADRVVLLDGVAASLDPHASLRFGPDGKLYVAFDDGGNPSRAAEPSSFNGKLLRLNPDGTTPDDQPRRSPIVFDGFASPRGLQWHGATNTLWDADERRVGRIQWTAAPNGIALSEDQLFVASDDGLERARIDRRVPGTLAAPQMVVRGLPVRAVAVAPDGTVHFATGDALGKLNP